MSDNYNNNNNNNDDGCYEDVSKWSREQDKAFEDAIATLYEGVINEKTWEMIALVVPGGKSVDEIKHHYEILVDDVSKIESGFVPLPCYNNSSGSDEQQSSSGDVSVRVGGERKVGRSEHERRKGIAWSEEEHRLFLLGLEKYGKGDWRSISRNFVVTRTPTQVASHAQKYFIRLNSMNKERRRTSIHDITSAVVDNGADGLFRPQ